MHNKREKTMAIRITAAGVGLTVGIIVLAAVIFGGLYLVKERGEQARREEAIKVAQNNLDQQSSETPALNEGDEASNPQEGTTQGGTDTTGNQGSTDTDTNADTETETNSGTSTDSASGDDVDTLPETGAGDIVPAVAMGILTFSVASYVVSRRKALQ